ncbi:hypothetical protein P7K49_014445 [Saguinus oedipus]|uniref:Mitotic-spindle organizing protein 2B n=1 Tax=Saguinus oedipus TaxID=9490 RepID=A0ABQ9VIT2_SAGOE|nr:hypothetical protein P7K49_014445 [Saguinus oedipus]
MAAQGAGPGPGSAASPGLEVARQKLALRRKKVLSAEEMELYELAQAAGGAIDPDVFKILVDLLKLNVAPLAVFQMLKSMCAGQRLASEPQDPAALSLSTSSVPETRGQSRACCPCPGGGGGRPEGGRRGIAASERCGLEWPGLFVGSWPSTCRAHPWDLLPGLTASLSRHIQVRWTQSTCPRLVQVG